MLDLTIPGFGELRIKHILIEYDGTLAIEGSLIDGVYPHLIALSKQFELHILLNDTYHTARKELSRLPCQFITMPDENQTSAKNDYLMKLGPDNTIAIGNSHSAQLMLEKARIGIAVLSRLGLSAPSLSHATLLVPEIHAAFFILRDERRLIATLRT